MLKRFKLVWALLSAVVTPAYAADAHGVTKTEIKIGAAFPFSGPAGVRIGAAYLFCPEASVPPLYRRALKKIGETTRRR
jgi:NAD(P)H-dependent flavin oxidoreductase YrpB (nitropropane dioxygenase family)